MSIEELRSFTVLAAHLHFGRAAEAIHVSQPALTKQMHRLEESLGGKLFERGKHGTTLTTLGARFVPQARELVASFERILANAQKEAQGRGGRLNVGFGYYTYELVPQLIVKLRTLEPDIEISLRDMSTAEQITNLQNGQLDVGFARLPLPPSTPALETRTVLSGQLALVTPLDETQRAITDLADCHDMPFVLLSKERSPGLYDRILKLCARHGFHPHIVQEVSEITTALALVGSGMGLSIIPESSWSRRFGGLRIHALQERAALWTVGAVWRRRDSNPVLHRFLDLLRSEVKAVNRKTPPGHND
jgi:DNA-binding transcriptional LysR family regulator